MGIRARGRTRMWRPRVWRWLLVAACVAAVAPVLAWGVTARRHAWEKGWPNYLTVHRGSLLLFSSLVEWPPRGADGKRVEWMWDVIGLKIDNGRGAWPRGAFRQMSGYGGPWVGWWPPVREIGNRYNTGGGIRWGRRMWMVEVPLWAFSLPALVGVVWAWRGWRRSRRAHAGNCAGCGYDLRGLGPGALCPECGRVTTGRGGPRGGRRSGSTTS